MKYGVIILIVAAVAQTPSLSQERLRPAKLLREIRRINAIADPQAAIEKVEVVLPTIPDNKKAFTRMRFVISLRLADLYVRTGAYAEAEKLLVSLVERVRATAPTPMQAQLGFEGTMYDCFERLGYFYLRTGNVRKAEAVFTESKSRRDAVFPSRSVHRIQPIVGFGSLHFARGDDESTYREFNRAEQLLSRATSTQYDYDIIARLYLNDLVEICLLQGRYEEAWHHIHNLSVASSGIGKFGSRLRRKLEISRILELKARYYLLKGDYGNAQAYLDRALHQYSSNLASSDVKFRILKTQALLYWYQDEIIKSSEAFLTLIRSYREHIARNFVAMSEYEKEQFYNTLKSDFGLFNAFAVDNHHAPGADLLFEEMYNNALSTKALLLNETNKIRNGIMQRKDQELIGKLRLWEDARARLATVYFNKTTTVEIDSLERKIEGLEKEINRQSNLFARNQNPPDWKRVKSALADSEAAVEIIRVNTVNKDARNNNGASDSTVYVGLVLKRDSKTPQPVFWTDGSQLEKRFLPFYRNSIMARTDDVLTYDRFWTPIKPALQGVRKVYLSADGVFNQINLNTLRNPVTRAFLIDEMNVSYVTNTGDLLKPEREPGETPTGVLFGRPAYDLKPSVNGNAHAFHYGTRNVLTDELSEFTAQRFSDLPGTEKEINAIARALRARNLKVHTYKGVDASEENIKDVAGPAILHIATHGFFVEDSASLVNPMIRSGLVMAGVSLEDKARTEDGILTAYEATSLNLDRTSLVVLSACETGLGEIRNGEGVYGLQRAIIVAGANNLLMSLWKVDDEATALLMGAFYSNWTEGENQSAFRKAQVALREKYPAPYYWGAFIMLGK